MTGMHGETEKERGGGGEAWRRGWGLRGFAEDLSHTRALLQATIACVVIVLKAWRPGPEPPLWTVVCGGRGFRFQSFSPPSCGLLDVFVLRAKVNLERNKEEGKHYHGTVHV